MRAGTLTMERTLALARRFSVHRLLPDLEERLLPCPEYVLCQDRKLSGVRYCNIVIVIIRVVNLVVVVYIELQEFAVVFLKIPVELWVLLGELGQFQHVRGALICVVQILSKKKGRQKDSSETRTVEFVHGCERRAVVVVVVHVDVGIFVFIFCVQTLIWLFNLERVNVFRFRGDYPSEAHVLVLVLLHEACP